MSATDSIVRIVTALLPIGTAVVGFLGGLVTVSVTDSRRRAETLAERRRTAMAGLVHVLADSAQIPGSKDLTRANQFVVEATEAAIMFELELSGSESLDFHNWIEHRLSRLFALFKGRESLETFDAYTSGVDALLEELMSYQRGNKSVLALRDRAA